MQYTYPAVFYYDEEYGDYAVEFSDICIYAEGDTMEDAYKNAQEYLVAYLETCEKLGLAPNKPNTYEDCLKDHPNGKIMLVTVEYEGKGKKQEKEKREYSTLQDEIVEDIEDALSDGENPTIKRYVEEHVFDEKKDIIDDGDDDFGLPEID